MKKLAICNMADVCYRDVPGFLNYQVGSDGSIWTCARSGPKTGTVRGKYRSMKPRLTWDGYLKVTLCKDGKVFSPRGVHIYVLLAFVGERPAEMVACHWDGNKLNNRVDNLRWGTPQDNSDDSIRLGETNTGSSNGNSKLTEGIVRKIRKFSGIRGAQARLAREYGIHRDTIRKIWSGKLWGSV